MTNLQNKTLVMNLFNLNNDKEYEETAKKLNLVETVWVDEGCTLVDLVGSWNDISNEANVTMNQMLDSFYKASATSKENNLSAEELDMMTVCLASVTREKGLIIGNALKSIITRISTDTVIDELNNRSINVTKADNANSVFDKIKSHINKLTNLDERSDEILNVAKIVGGNYHIARASAIIHNL